MKKYSLFLVVIALIVSCKETKPLVATQQNTFTAIVNDFSIIFTQAQRDSLKNKILEFEKKTTNEIAIVTLDSIRGDMAVFATNLAEEIGVGKKDKNNGLLILFVKPLRKVRITTGIGTRKALTDPFCQDIINTKMIPEFEKGNFYKGVDTALDEIILRWTND